ncbi:MAG: phosphoribosyltransferase [Caulobacteraceae bacterium]
MEESAPKPLVSEREVARRVRSLANRLAPLVDEETILVPILMGALWFAADLSRALAKLGCNPAFDALWLASYGEERTSSGPCQVLASLQRSVAGRRVIILDEVVESGASLAAAVEIVRAGGARETATCVFACKPSAGRPIEPDFAAWEAPPAFLVGYGMDLAGRRRAFPWIGAAPPAAFEPA